MAKIVEIRPHKGFQEKFVRTNVDVCFGGGVLGGGKLLDIDELVLTPSGWVRNGDLCVGMLVNTPWGKPARILQIFDHKDKDIYELETSDGRKSKCGEEHLWAFRTRKQVFKYRQHGIKGKNLTVETTGDLIKRLNVGDKIYLPLADEQEQNEASLVIPPYALGIMLGDGCLTDSVWTAHRQAIPISSNEEDVIRKFSDAVGGTRVHRNKGTYTNMVYTPNANIYHTYCKEHKLNTYSYNKYIPQEYLNSSIRQRRLLLQGLFDTDGCVEKKNGLSFSTTSPRLADDFIYLCRSLGYKATKKIDNRANKYTNGVAYTVRVHTDDIIFTSSKHYSRYNNNLEKYYYKYKRTEDHVRIKSIKYLYKKDARCIVIDDPLHLYITNDFIVTHNSFGAVLATVEPSQDPNWHGLFLRNNLDDLKAGGGLIDTFREVYGDTVKITTADMPRVTFPSGAYCDVTHVSDQSPTVVDRRFKGRQYDMIYFDEGTGFSWQTFTSILSRNRGTSQFAGHCLLTTNPEREHWIRTFIDWYIGDDGYIMDERDGRVRFFYMMGSDVKDVVWGDSKEDVYIKCKADIDRKLDRVYGYMKGREKWPAMIKSFTFYQGRMSENTEMLANNEGYLGSIAMAGGAEAAKKLEGNWNVSSKDEGNDLITFDEANSVFFNDPQINGDRWVTCDLADTGTDNLVALSWDGLHITDMMILNRSTPRENAERLRIFAAEHDVADSHIIYDAIRGRYINDYIEEAQPFESYRAPIGLYSLQYAKLKDECYGKLLYLVKNNGISMNDNVAGRQYVHQKLKESVTVQNEFIEEIRVVRWVDAQSGKKRLMTKKEMNKLLGKGRSMDLLDPCAMRMYPLLSIADGYELENGRAEALFEDNDDTGKVNIYDDTVWY